MKARIKWVDGMTFIGESESGHGIVMDASPEVGGRNLGPRPMEMLLLGTGGCSSIDVMMILKKSRQAVSDCYVEMSAERAETDPKVFTKIHMHFVVKGKDIKPEAVEKAVKLSAEKYCSASIMLGATAEMTHDFEVVQE
jgi:putative redox protein